MKRIILSLCIALLLTAFQGATNLCSAGDLVISNRNNNVGVGFFKTTDQGDVAPLRQFFNSVDNTTDVRGMAMDGNYIYLLSETPRKIYVFDRSASGSVAPVRTIEGAATQLSSAVGYLTLHNNELYAAMVDADKILVFQATDSGNVAPTRVITGANTQFNFPIGISIYGNYMYVANGDGDQILVFDKNADGDIAPVRVISGANTQLRAPHDTCTDGTYLYVANRPTNAANNRITVYNINDSGDVAPQRVIQGSNANFSKCNDVLVYNNELYVIDGGTNDRVAVFNAMDSGDVAPKRVIQGPSTLFDGPMQAVIDPGPLAIGSDGSGGCFSGDLF